MKIFRQSVELWPSYNKLNLMHFTEIGLAAVLNLFQYNNRILQQKASVKIIKYVKHMSNLSMLMNLIANACLVHSLLSPTQTNVFCFFCLIKIT